MPITNTQEVYEIRSISPVHINPSIMEGRHLYPSILGPDRAISIVRYAPIFLVNPVLSGDPGIPSLLTCSPGVVDASPAPERHYQWFLDGEPDVGGAGVAFSTFLTDPIHDGVEITCLVTATNVLGEASALSNGIVASLIEPVIIGEYDIHGITGLTADESVTVFQDQIAVLTGMWVDDFLTTFATHGFIVSGISIQDTLMMYAHDTYAAEFIEFLGNVSITNSGAESGTTGWTATAGAVRSVTATNPVGSGTKVFKGTDVVNTASTFYSDSNISSTYEDEIDAGEVFAILGFYASRSGTSDFDHQMKASIAFIDSTNAVTSTIEVTDYLKPELNDGANRWNYIQSQPMLMPVDTREIRVIFDITGENTTGGSTCQIDNVTLQLYKTL